MASIVAASFTYHSLSLITPIKTHSFHLKATMMETSEITEKEEVGVSQKKKIFVAGANGNTGKRIVQQLLAKGFAVKAGVRDIDKAKMSFSDDNPDLQFSYETWVCKEGQTGFANRLEPEEGVVWKLRVSRELCHRVDSG